ncbi:uncharacterized protein LOC119740176 [Patiria miniata]|uniref:C1q domain-containing protein n=1 Tax=Patiria miniata TaxID=46514 RepID=A0A914B4Z2_PATMI|nr:uncharacterized protein LOC119740176 [Patiria miniata]XP_038071322.1 uncharacterized protein LOC119740176 [Patiria miniata]
MTNLTSRLFLGLPLLLLLSTTGTLALSTFHQDVAFSYIDTEDITQFPRNTYDEPPLLDRLGTGPVFVAPFPGTYVFSFHAPGTGKNFSGPPSRINYQFSWSPGGVNPQSVLRLTGDGPVAGHALLDLESDDRVMIEILSGSATPIVNTTTPVIFNGFLLYHRCLCSPLVLRQSAFSASRKSTGLGPGTLFIDYFEMDLGREDEFDTANGIFTASLPGIYVFMYSFPNQGVGRPGSVTVSLTVNDAVKSSVTSVSSAAAIVEYAGTTVVLDLVVGDRVRLEKRGGQLDIPEVYVGGTLEYVSPILFSGFLL